MKKSTVVQVDLLTCKERKPKSLSMHEAAALPMVGITAYEGLQSANVRPNQKVLVHDGTGGVGHVAIQLAKHFCINSRAC